MLQVHVKHLFAEGIIVLPYYCLNYLHEWCINFVNRYNQATAMCRHYKRPILLIEFDESKSFSLQVKQYIILMLHCIIMELSKLLQSTSTIQGEISNQSVASKLVLLTLHFPNVLLLDVVLIYSLCCMSCHCCSWDYYGVQVRTQLQKFSKPWRYYNINLSHCTQDNCFFLFVFFVLEFGWVTHMHFIY